MSRASRSTAGAGCNPSAPPRRARDPGAGAQGTTAGAWALPHAARLAHPGLRAARQRRGAVPAQPRPRQSVKTPSIQPAFIKDEHYRPVVGNRVSHAIRDMTPRLRTAPVANAHVATPSVDLTNAFLT